MILPGKHTRISESVVGVGALILAQLEEPLSFDELCTLVEARVEQLPSAAPPSADDVFRALLFLKIIGLLSVDGRGRISL